MIDEATVDAYGEGEQRTGLFTMPEEYLDLPFTTTVLGIEVTVCGVDLTLDGMIVALCSRSRVRQSIGILDLPLPSQAPEGANGVSPCSSGAESSGKDRGVPPLGRLRPDTSHLTRNWLVRKG
nr:calcium-binding protein [Streptomyces incarnatus]